MGGRGSAGASLAKLKVMAKDAGFESYGEAYQTFTNANQGIMPNAKNMESWLKQRSTNIELEKLANNSSVGTYGMAKELFKDRTGVYPSASQARQYIALKDNVDKISDKLYRLSTGKNYQERRAKLVEQRKSAEKELKNFFDSIKK